MKLRLSCALLGVAVATAATAQTDKVSVELACVYTVECLSGESCDATEYEMQLTLEETAQSPLIKMVQGSFSTVAETIDLAGFYKDGALSVNGGAVFPTSHFITVGADGSAIYTTHVDPAFGITYLGTCS